MNSDPFKSRHELPSLGSSLLDQVQQMQPDAWSRLVQVFSPIVYHWARKAGLPGDDAADIVQDVFVAVAKNIHQFERRPGQASFRPWLATITRNRVRDWFRQQQQLPAARGGTENLQQFQNHADVSIESPSEEALEKSISLDQLDARIPRQVLEAIRSDCDERTWQAFWFTTVVGDAAADVADRLSMPVASVYQAKSRILRRIRKRLEKLP